MDLDKEELEATKKHHKRRSYKYINTEYQDVKRLNKLFNTKFNYEIWEVKKENENRKRDLL